MQLLNILFEQKIGDYVHLTDVFDGEEPDEDEIIWSQISREDFQNVLYKVVPIDPVEIVNTWSPDGSQTYKDVYFRYAEKWQRRLVRLMRTNLSTTQDRIFIITTQYERPKIIDGNHGIMALALEGIHQAKAVDLAIWKENKDDSTI